MAPYIKDGEYVPGSKKRRRFRKMASAEIDEEMKKYAKEPLKESEEEETEGLDYTDIGIQEVRTESQVDRV